MKEFFNDLFEYHHHFNQLMIDELEKYQLLLPQRSIPLFCHVLNASQIWNSRILGYTSLGVHVLHTFDECRKINKIILDQYDPDKVIGYKNSLGETFSNSLRDILFHSANHVTHHRGQLISDFRQAGISPLGTDYIFYCRNKTPEL